MRISRADNSRLTEWWFTTDFVLLAAVLILAGMGLVLSLAASPSVALRAGFPAYHFVIRHAFFALAGAVIVVTVSLLDPRTVRRLSLVVLGVSLAGLVYVHFYGAEINGARRWLSLAGHSLQPSEFAKPAFVVVSAWLLAEARDRPGMPALPIAVVLVSLLAALLVSQPDVGSNDACARGLDRALFCLGPARVACGRDWHRWRRRIVCRLPHVCPRAVPD